MSKFLSNLWSDIVKNPGIWFLLGGLGLFFVILYLSGILVHKEKEEKEIVVVAPEVKNELKEEFKMIPFRPQIEGPYGLGFSQAFEPVPLHVNFIPKLLSQDFQLSAHIKKLKMMSNSPTIINGGKRAYIRPQDHTGIDSSLGPIRNPIFFAPDVGASKVFVKWSRPNGSTMSAKKTDAYNKFQTETGWSCKDTELTWNTLWFPNDDKGLSRYCWQDLVKTDLSADKKDVINVPGTTTEPNTLGSMDFESDIYSVLIEMLYAMSYVQGSSLFGLSYDHRLIFSPKQFQKWSDSVKGLVEKYVRFNGRLAILMGHGFGSVLINLFLNNMSKEWKDEYIAAFITVSGSFGDVPKALRVLLSGDVLPEKTEQDLIRTGLFGASALHAMIPSVAPSLGPVVEYDNQKFSAKDIQRLVSIAGEALYNEQAAEICNIVRSMKEKSLMNPGTNVHIFTGSGLDTENFYVYKDILGDPVKTTYIDGDGTVPSSSLNIPVSWRSMQSNPVTYKTYIRSEHSRILKLYEPMKDLSDLITMYNDN